MGELFFDQFDVLDAEGLTSERKPYFRILARTASGLAPQTDSPPVSIRLRNKDYVAVFTPSFRVLRKNARHRNRNARNHRHHSLRLRHPRSPALPQWTSPFNC